MIDISMFLTLIGVSLAIPPFAGIFDGFVHREIRNGFSSWLEDFSSPDLSKKVKELNNLFIELFESFFQLGPMNWWHAHTDFVLVAFPSLLGALFLNQYFDFGLRLWGVLLSVLLLNLFFLVLVRSKPDPAEFSTLFFQPTDGLLLLIYLYYLPLTLAGLIMLSTLAGIAVMGALKVKPEHVLEIAGTHATHISAALTTSFISLAVLSLALNHVLSGFWEYLQLNGWQDTGYILINIVADFVSLTETFVILKWARRKPSSWLPFIVILDVLISAFIFLSIPLAAGELPTFLAAITFEGPQPWLGLLFWSTFATSIIFYLFVLGSIGLGFLYVLVRNTMRLQNIFKVTERPFLSLGFVLSFFIMTGAFVGLLVS